MREEQNAVKEFHKVFGHPVSEVPVVLPIKRAQIRHKWMQEELTEFLEATVMEDIVEQADAMIDLIYFALGTLVEMGVDGQVLFDIVQKSNMAKLWDDGQAHYNADGKVVKSDTWKDPHGELKKAIETMLNL